MRTTTLVAIAVAVCGAMNAATPPPAGAQSVLGKVKSAAKKSVTDQKRRTEQGIVDEAVEPLDSTLAKGARPVEGAVTRTTAHVDSAVSRAERSIAASLKGEPREVRRIVAALRDGRFVLDQIVFLEGTDQLAAAGELQLAALAEALGKVDGSFLVEGHVAPTDRPKAGVALSERRAAAVKAWLVEAGVPANRLFGVGHGSARPPERIEIVRMS